MWCRTTLINHPPTHQSSQSLHNKGNVSSLSPVTCFVITRTYLFCIRWVAMTIHVLYCSDPVCHKLASVLHHSWVSDDMLVTILLIVFLHYSSSQARGMLIFEMIEMPPCTSELRNWTFDLQMHIILALYSFVYIFNNKKIFDNIESN